MSWYAHGPSSSVMLSRSVYLCTSLNQCVWLIMEWFSWPCADALHHECDQPMQPCWSYPGQIFCPTDDDPEKQCKDAAAGANSSKPVVPFQEFHYDIQSVSNELFHKYSSRARSYSCILQVAFIDAFWLCSIGDHSQPTFDRAVHVRVVRV